MQLRHVQIQLREVVVPTPMLTLGAIASNGRGTPILPRQALAPSVLTARIVLVKVVEARAVTTAVWRAGSKHKRPGNEECAEPPVKAAVRSEQITASQLSFLRQKTSPSK